MHKTQTVNSPHTTTERRLRVTVLRGGPSPERDVSLVSGQAVADALRRRGHDVFEADIHPDHLEALSQPADMVFPALHGTFGEDGVLQHIMESRGIRFVGSGAQASALAMDKVASKQRVLDMGLPTPAYEVWTTDATPDNLPKLPLPLVVKPADQGSSVDTFVVREPAELPPAITTVVQHFGRALVEQYIAGDELTVGIIGGEALPPICVRPRRAFYDYTAKYQDDATEYLFDAGHPESLLTQAQEWSRRVFEGFGCRHLGRIDWMVDADGRLWFLEVNTIPGFTTHSLVPKAAARVGVSFDELVERLVRMALAETS
ncbi:MAG: D-alanine--D-alanine ligase [Phycisphaerae bacterium]|jgi:D-alanine-D-alanine ligase